MEKYNTKEQLEIGNHYIISALMPNGNHMTTGIMGTSYTIRDRNMQYVGIDDIIQCSCYVFLDKKSGHQMRFKTDKFTYKFSKNTLSDLYFQCLTDNIFR